jgi:hypothetical protein
VPGRQSEGEHHKTNTALIGKATSLGSAFSDSTLGNNIYTRFWRRLCCVCWGVSELRGFLCLLRDRRQQPNNDASEPALSGPANTYSCTVLRNLTVVSLLWSACAGQSFGNGTNQQQAQWCDGKSGMCMAINIPSASAPDYYLAITAPQAIGYVPMMRSTYSDSVDGLQWESGLKCPIR